MIPKLFRDNWRAVKKRITYRRLANHWFTAQEIRSLIQAVRPYTMVGFDGLANVFELASAVIDNKIPGDFVECGVWRGGCSAILAQVAVKCDQHRRTHLFDSFEGLPEPVGADGVEAATHSSGKTDGKLVPIGFCAAPYEVAARLLFDVLKLPTDRVVVHRGWFQETLPSARDSVGPIALLRLDGDWYESTKVVLENLYDSVVPGGYVVIDDYGVWEGCRRAVDEFIEKREIETPLTKVDDDVYYLRKN